MGTKHPPAERFQFDGVWMISGLGHSEECTAPAVRDGISRRFGDTGLRIPDFGLQSVEMPGLSR